MATVSLSSPLLLVLGVLVAAALAVGVVLVSRRRATALASAGISLPARRGRQLGAWFTLGGLVVLAIAVSGPLASIPVGHEAGTVIVAMDVSNSMGATDVAPTRLQAAKTAAIAFVNAQPDNVNIGVVGFDQGAITSSLTSSDRGATVTAISALRVSGGTSLGAAILASLTAITGKPVVIAADGTVPKFGYWGSASIVLFSDGEDQASPDAAVAAATAAENAGIHIDTVGVGTAAGTSVKVDGYQIHTALDADTLTTIAQTTGGAYHPASDVDELNGIASTINLRLAVADEDVPLAGAFIGFALVLLGIGAVFAVLRTGRLV